MAKKFTKLSKGSGGSADDRVKYVTYMDRGAELIKYPVIEGDTARDPVIKGYVEKPTKEPTESTVYTQSGWSKTDGGAPDSTALQNVTEDRTVYAAFTESVRTYTIRFFDDAGSLIEAQQIAYGITPIIPERDNYTIGVVTPELSPVTSDMDYYVQYIEATELKDTSWARIAELSAAGTAENYWAVRDTKGVHLKGKVGTLELDETLYVYIIGFNHNSAKEGNGITFGTFKSAASGGEDVCLVDSKAATSDTAGTMLFNINHWGTYNGGGWAGCDMRYDILGSTNVAPSVYGKSKTTSCVGKNPSDTCATSPKANTLMAALPSDLRAVMKPMTKYTDNKGGTTLSTSNVTASMDYLPLLAEYEIFGVSSEANSAEQNYQQQYAYFASGNSKNKYKHNDTSSAVFWWVRSPNNGGLTYWCIVRDGTAGGMGCAWVYGLAPIFKV